MTLLNPYVRASVVSLVIFVAVFFRYLQRYGPSRDSRHMVLVVSTLAVSLVITTALVGTFAKRSEKPWRWLKVTVVSFGCWLAVLIIMLLAQRAFYSR